MSWLLNLYQTYEANLAQVGKVERRYDQQEFTLLPVSHTTQNAHIEVAITEDGQFHSATVVDKQEASTLIPCTEESASRAGSTIAPYPLHDKLSYVAGDFVEYGGVVKDENPFDRYIQNLKAWADSPYATPKVKSIYAYLSQGRLIRDLIDSKILYVDDRNCLIEKWNDQYQAEYGERPPIYSVIAGGIESAFVRFTVYSPDRVLPKVWKDPEMYDSFIRFYRERLGKPDYCYVTGQLLPSTDRHANKIRHAADKAKLISANDKSGFTFRGRFQTGSEAASISYEVSQKAHNALKWLINRQGKMVDQRVFLVWGNDEPDMPGLTEDLFTLAPEAASVTDRVAFTNREFAREVAKAMDGYRSQLSTKANVNILILDSATTGRMAVLYYRNMEKELYLDRLVDWHTSCAWLHRYRKDENGNLVTFYGAPATRDIAFAAYGSRADDKLVKGLMERIIPCILDKQRIPLDIETNAFHRASNPVSMDRWEWEKTLSIACALINRRLEGYSVALDEANQHRDYLFGRLLAVADVLERNALGVEETRATNAVRYMNAFSRHPARTWKTIQESLQPYQARLGTRATYWNRMIDEIGSRISLDDFNNKPLSGIYLLGYYSQRQALYTRKNKSDDSES